MSTEAATGAAGVATDAIAREALMAWYRGEFAAANAIIDALCGHLAQIRSSPSEYVSVFAAVNRRRTNWIPVIQMQRYYPITNVVSELRRVADNRLADGEAKEERLEMPMSPPPPMEAVAEQEEISIPSSESVANTVKTSDGEDEEEVEAEVEAEVEGSDEYSTGDSPDPKTEEESGESGDGGSQTTGHDSLESIRICANHEDCADRPDRIKILKGFVRKEPMKGHMVNVVKGLKVYEDIFTNMELLKLGELINELRLAGRRGDLSGETFIYFNKQMKGNKREIIQLGVPLFQPTNEEATSNIEPIPPILQTVIDHLVQWRLIPDSRKPNSCIINFFDEDEYSQPYFKPPHLDNPISTLLLSETTMTFGRVLASFPNGNYKGSLTLSLKEGSLLVMRGNSADMAKHVICPSTNRRVSITFVKVRATDNQANTAMAPPPVTAMTLWQPALLPHKVSRGGANCFVTPVLPSWDVALQTPLLMLAPPRSMAMNPVRRVPRSNGTGVFLPWSVSPKKYTRRLPPRIQKMRLPSQLETEDGKMSQI